MILSFILGQVHYKVPYNLKKFFIYVASGIVIYLISIPLQPMGNLTLLEYGYHTLLLLSFVVLVVVIEKPFKEALK